MTQSLDKIQSLVVELHCFSRRWGKNCTKLGVLDGTPSVIQRCHPACLNRLEKWSERKLMIPGHQKFQAEEKAQAECVCLCKCLKG